MVQYEHAGVKGLRRLLDAVMIVGSELSLPVVLRRLTETAAELVDAQYAALGVLDRDRTSLSEFITVGISPEERARIGDPPKGHGILGLLIVDPKPLRLPDLTAHPDSFGFPPGHPPMTSFLGVPILLRDEVFGNLYLTDKRGGEVFTDVDEELVVGLAAAAGLAIENARLHENAATMALLEERERIARDLHDDVIQRLFAAGLSLQSTAQMADQPVVRERLEQAVADLDTTIRQVRTAIFQLGRPPSAPSLRAELLAVCADAKRPLGFEPQCEVHGPIDSAVPARAGEHVVLALREALSNVARHARASHVDVDVDVTGERLRLRVVDDGVGIDPAALSSGSGIRNMAERAQDLGGVFSVAPGPGGGTAIVWEIPLES